MVLCSLIVPAEQIVISSKRDGADDLFHELVVYVEALVLHILANTYIHTEKA